MSDSPRARRLGKVRRENVDGGPSKSIQVYVTDIEKAALTVRAIELKVAVPRLLFESALSETG
ncbi:hypothetical protein J2Y41_004707 [Arthrobacter sp. 1088]|uniref:hypothetical protein n=1 Tax=Arthrobacter sp. 1088 TaxID=2817768 RepID=UPI002867AD11|nr:hypothetical protein [Arthrobacter sp. 1088]MDR6689101.1 hypothetical protein [Arthrobacter sp. 1088]